MDSFFQDSFKVNMGNKKDLTKEQLLKENREQRQVREKARREGNAATLIQKYLRSYKSNKDIALSILEDKQAKVRETMAVFRVLSVKKPEQKDVIFKKGMSNLSKYIVTLLNTLLLTLGSIDSTARRLRDPRQLGLYSGKLQGVEKLVSDLLFMFNDQYKSKNEQILQEYVGLRMVLVKAALTFLALGLNLTYQTAAKVDSELLQSCSTLLFNEISNQNCNIINMLLCTEVPEQQIGSNAMVPNPYLFSFFNKHLLKMIVVQVTERSFQQQLSEFEYSLLNTCRSLVCWTGIFEYQLNTCE
jgi:hypothetical protein